MAWHTIRSFGATEYPANMRLWDPGARTFRFRCATCSELTLEMLEKDDWYVAGWKIHLSIYPADYTKALPTLRLLDERMAPLGLVFKYAGSKRLYEGFTGEVKGKFATIYCKAPTDVPAVVQMVNQLFAREGVTPVNRSKIDELEGLKHELPLTGGFGFARYGAFCYTNGILDLTDANQEPMRDNRRLAYPQFKDPARLSAEMAAFGDLILSPPFVG